MHRFKDWKIGVKLMVLSLIAGIGFVIFGVIAYSTVSVVKIGGNDYQAIQLKKDLNSDVIPPTLYLSEARMNVLASLLLDDQDGIQKRLDDYQEDEKAFVQAYNRYSQQLPDGRVKNLMQGKVFVFSACESE